jgi:predicted MFS family arabinose efflux permease
MKGSRGGVAALLRDWAPWTGLAGLFVSFAGLSALWAFVTQLAPTFGVSSQAASTAFMIALVASGVAGIAATAIGDRLGRATPLAVGMLLAIAGAAALQWGHGFPGYLAGIALAVGLWNFPMAYQIGMIASADERGHVAVLMPAALAIGGALGPVFAGSLLANGHSYAPLYALFAVATAVGMAAFIVLGRRLAKSRQLA